MPKYRNKSKVKRGRYLQNYWQLRRQKNQLQNQRHQSLTDTNSVQSSETSDLSSMTFDEKFEQNDDIPHLVIEEEESQAEIKGASGRRFVYLAEFQADEDAEFGARAHVSFTNSPPRTRNPVLRVAASAPPPLPPSAHPMMWPEEPRPRLRPGINTDECQVFGDFVASELRTLRSDESRKRLKRIIQKAILQIGEEEDVNIITG